MAEQEWVPEGGGEEKEFSALEPGFYTVRIEEIAGEYTKKAGEPMVVWTLVVTDAKVEGSKLFHRTVLSAKSMSYPGDGFYALLDRFGLSGVLEGKNIPFEEMVILLETEGVGKEAMVAVSQYLYRGKPRNDCDEFFKMTAEGGPPHQIFEESDPRSKSRGEEAPAGASVADAPY